MSRVLFVALMVLSLTVGIVACNSGESQSPTFGIYVGSSTYEITVGGEKQKRTDMSGVVVTPDGKMVTLVAVGKLVGYALIGSIDVKAGRYSENVRQYQYDFDGNNVLISHGSARQNGTYEPRTKIAGSFDAPDLHGDFNVTYRLDLSLAGSSLSKVAGEWWNGTTDISSLTINKTGDFFMQSNEEDSNDQPFTCTFNGNITPVDPKYNLYRIEGTRACGNKPSDAYTGMAFTSNSGNKLNAFIYNNNYAGAITLDRQ